MTIQFKLIMRLWTALKCDISGRLLPYRIPVLMFLDVIIFKP